MFTIVLPKSHDLHRDSITLLEKLFDNNPNLNTPFQDKEQAIYLIEDNVLEGYVGGALLVKSKMSSLHRKMGYRDMALSCHKEEVWTCSISLQIQNAAFDFEAMGKIFYQRLYKELVNFGTENNVSFLYLILDPGEYLCTEALGFWPYVVENRPQESIDGLFHGLLSLAKKRPTVKTSSLKPPVLTDRLAA
ncbi:hypothetical protein QM565_32635 [Geitlerinema splendidum]|jgi:hypothetical protein|nr:hypothetical protein [Geitlerinema splendidum]